MKGFKMKQFLMMAAALSLLAVACKKEPATTSAPVIDSLKAGTTVVDTPKADTTVIDTPKVDTTVTDTLKVDSAVVDTAN